MSDILMTPFELGPIHLKNRVVMAPMTRCRATADHVPTDLMAAYYKQRASAGLIVTEGTAPAPEGLGYARIPGLFNAAHVAAWKKITDAIHIARGRVFIQLMHTGRVSHPLNMPAGARILAPSAVALSTAMWTDQQGMQPFPVPSEMTEAEILATVRAYADSAGYAIEAGFDGVELHGANGYLIDQFLNTASNRRADRWGGSIENRIRFPLEVARAVIARIGADRLGMRISPFGVFNDMKPDDAMADLYEKLAAELSALNLVYLHVNDQGATGAPPMPDSMLPRIRRAFKGALVLAGGYDQARAEADLAANKGDLVAFARLFISNPDAVQRFRERRELAPSDATTFYTPGEKGYIDYPALA